MASYTRNIQMVKPRTRINSRFNRLKSNTIVAGQPDNIGVGNNFASVLPEIYAGHPQRVQRYAQYQQMDMDSDINSSLDTISDFSTQADETNNNLFQFSFEGGSPADVEVNILNMCLRKWTKLNEFQNRLWRILRNTLMYGDVFFVRDPETSKWLFVDPALVESIIVDRQQGKKIIAYAVRDLVVNEEALVASDQTQFGSNLVGQGTNTLQNNIDPQTIGGGAYSPNFNSSIQNLTLVKSEYMVHLSLSEGLDANWPFGTSFLESVYKPYRQKSLLEDAMLIYRIQRAPERRVFYIDTGDLPPHKAAAYIEKVKNDTRQRRIPTRNGGGESVTSSAYNPLCLDMNTRIPLLDGRTLSIYELTEEYNNGKENWVYSCNPETGEIVPGNITWAGHTRKNAKVIKITLDNGETLITTPDHKIPVRNKGFIEAQYITSEDSLFSFSNNNKLAQSRATIVGNFFKKITNHQILHYKNNNQEKNSIHFKDLNCSNIDPRNIQYMDNEDRILLLKNEYDIKSYEEYEIPTIIGSDKIVSIEWLEDTMDVGTITVDGNERWHNFHTFAVESGIFVKNSMIEDYFFAQSSCLKLDTKIPLLDGRDLSLQEIINEYHEGKINYVYSQNTENNKLEAGKIVWADKTRLNAEVYEITLDNGKKITATPDHLFILRDGREIEAQYLKPDDSLMPMELSLGYSGPNQKEGKYVKYISNVDGKKRFVHIDIAGKHKGKDTEVHHIDFNSKNNNPDNLLIMDKQKHREFHIKNGSMHLSNAWSNPEKRQRLIEGMRNLYDNRSDEFNNKLSERNKKNALSSWRTPDEELLKTKLEQLSDARKKALEKNTIVYTVEMVNYVVKIFHEGYNSISKLRSKLSSDEKFISIFMKYNKNNTLIKNNCVYIDSTTLSKMFKLIGYNTYSDFKNEYNMKINDNKTPRQNHKVVSVSKLDERYDTGDITIETPSGSHIFALSAGIFVHNSGRGSKVTTLEGGDALSSIDDMRYFSNLLKRGLRVPASYLPTGPDDNGVVFNDGRAGTAYIQEFRFAEFCRRIQRLLTPVFNKEFKKFVEDSGYVIDSDLYDIMFNPPQHFGEFARVERDVAMINTFTPLVDIPWMSKRFLSEKYLGWSKEDIAKNEMMWVEEHPDETYQSSDAAGFVDQAASSSVPGLDSIGIRDDSMDEVTTGGEDDIPPIDTGTTDNEQTIGLSPDQE